ncbi:uncharacterized protein LOC141716893 [Apium graveolens]|uniref:uncharacterized protein LOC141716893 n=1 Tax=Apium graveolens TaxID=4045 RepID=UPI003D78F86B
MHIVFIKLLLMASIVASYSSAAMGSTSSSSIIDINHPYYLHPSDNPGIILTTVILDEQNYSQWKRSMEIALASKLKIGVDGTYVQPAANSPLLAHWLRCNNMVTSWILNSVVVTIRNNNVYMKYAKTIWDDLQLRYAQTNVPKLFSLRKEISHLTQGTLAITAYFTKFKTIHDELDCIAAKPRGQILLMQPLPSLSQCYAMLLQDKNQRVVSGQQLNSTKNMAMSVKSTYGLNSNFKKTVNSSPVYCEYCHMTGHVKEK